MSEHQTRVLVLGVTGKIGSSLLRVLATSPDIEVMGTARDSHGELLPAALRSKLVGNVNVDNFDTVITAFAQARPDVVINCVGMIKQLPGASEPLAAIPLNALLPHRLANLCGATQARLVQISSDCVFSGDKGNYLESDPTDAQDLYGRSKALGEVDYPHAVTLRTSTIGRALQDSHSLLDWFLSTTGPVKGFRRAIFSGVPAHELARIIRDFVISVSRAMRTLSRVGRANRQVHASQADRDTVWARHADRSGRRLRYRSLLELGTVPRSYRIRPPGLAETDRCHVRFWLTHSEAFWRGGALDV